VQFRATLNKVLLALETSEHLPLKVRRAVKTAKMENGMTNMSTARSTLRSFGHWFVKTAGKENESFYAAFYGMQNEHELFAEMFQDHQFVEILQKTKMPKGFGETVLQYFSKAWNRLFNGKPEADNAFTEILLGFENYLGGPKKGSFNGRDYLRDALIAKGVRPEGLASRIDTLEKLYSTGDLTHSLEGFVRESQNDLLPATAEKGPINEALQTSLLGEAPTGIFQAAKNLLAGEVPSHQELWARLRQDISTVQELRMNIQKGYVPGSIPEGLEEKLRQNFTKLNALKNGLDKNAAAIEKWGNLQNFTSEGFEDTLAAQLVQRRLPSAGDPPPNQDLAHSLFGFTDELVEIRRETASAQLEGKTVASRTYSKVAWDDTIRKAAVSCFPSDSRYCTFTIRKTIRN